MLRYIFLFAAAPLVLASCEHSGPFVPEENGPDGPTLENIQAAIFTPSCAVSGCHLGANAQQGLDLSAGAASGGLIGVDSRELPSFKRVEPGNPDDSYLVMKIEGDSRIVGQRMPLGRPALSGEQMAMVREWITNLTEGT